MALSRAQRCLVLLLRFLSRVHLALIGLASRAPFPVAFFASSSSSSPPLSLSLFPSGKAAAAAAAVVAALPAPRNAARAVPPPEQPLLLLSATELARWIRRRKVACVDVIETYIARIKQVNPLINAVVKDRFKAALQEAHQVDQLLSECQDDEEALEEKFPFLGVPVTIKEAFELHGLPNTSGLVNRRNIISRSDAMVVSRLKQAGAIPLGVTNCSELCMWFESSNRIYGRSNNPYDLQCIVGGSSGGEGSILGAAGSVIGVGSDVGGSIRMPAFFNGIFGHKPTTGVVPNEGQFPTAVGIRRNFLCTGPMCRYAEDLEPMLRVMAGPNVAKLKLNEEVSLGDIKFYSMEHDGGSIFVSPVDKELLQAHRKAASRREGSLCAGLLFDHAPTAVVFSPFGSTVMETMGREVVKRLETDLATQVQSVAIHDMKYSLQIWSVMMSAKTSDGQETQAFTDLLGDHGKPVWPSWELLKWLLGMSPHTLPAIALGIGEKFLKYTPKQNARLAAKAQRLQAEMVNLLGDDGVLLYPSHPVVAPKHHTPLAMPFNFAYTAIFNILGLPVTQCPLGLNKDGLPLGIQVVAGPHNDHLTLAVARYLEKAFGGWVPPGTS